ncbi:MAG: hypothetical protein SNJ73_02650 [Acetobacteraceae bacterium]
MPRLAVVMFVSALVLAAAPARADRDPCPPPGTVAVRDDGSRWLFLGQDASEEGMCLIRVGDRDLRLLFGVWAPVGPDVAEARSALSALLTAGPGKTVTIREHVATDSWTEVWERGADETLELATGTRRAFRLERHMRLAGPVGFSARVTYWIDTETGVVLRTVHRHLEGLRLPYRDMVMTRLDRRG